jgi:hypothetical protein
MIRLEYKMQFAATFAFYDGLRIKIEDTCEISEQHKELFHKLGVDSSVPYSKELWDALSAEGEFV